MENKYRNLYVDWWNIRKSTIYTLIALIVAGGVTQSLDTKVEIGDDRGNRTGFIISLRNGNVLRRY